MRPRTTLTLTLTLAAASLAAVAGCTLNRSALRKTGEDFLGRVGDSARVIEPKRCYLEVSILPKPVRDRVVNETVWGAADEQVLPAETRRALQANGLRVGVLTGGLPAEVEAALNAPPPNRIDPARFNQPDGSPAYVNIAPPLPSASLLLNLDGHTSGRDYHDASGFFRVTASHEGSAGVSLKFVPEVHHGPIQRRYDAVPNGGNNLNPMEFTPKDGQQEDSLRELAAAVTLQPGQVAVVGCDPERKGSLGAFLFTRPEPNSDRLTQRLLLVRAGRTNVTPPGSQAADRPKLVPEEPPDLPATPAPDAKTDAVPVMPPVPVATPAPAAAKPGAAEPPSRDDQVTRAGLAPAGR